MTIQPINIIFASSQRKTDRKSDLNSIVQERLQSGDITKVSLTELKKQIEQQERKKKIILSTVAVLATGTGIAVAAKKGVHKKLIAMFKNAVQEQRQKIQPKEITKPTETALAPKEVDEVLPVETLSVPKITEEVKVADSPLLTKPSEDVMPVETPVLTKPAEEVKPLETPVSPKAAEEVNSVSTADTQKQVTKLVTELTEDEAEEVEKVLLKAREIYRHAEIVMADVIKAVEEAAERGFTHVAYPDSPYGRGSTVYKQMFSRLSDSLIAMYEYTSHGELARVVDIDTANKAINQVTFRTPHNYHQINRIIAGENDTMRYLSGVTSDHSRGSSIDHDHSFVGKNLKSYTVGVRHDHLSGAKTFAKNIEFSPIDGACISYTK